MDLTALRPLDLYHHSIIYLAHFAPVPLASGSWDLRFLMLFSQASVRLIPSSSSDLCSNVSYPEKSSLNTSLKMHNQHSLPPLQISPLHLTSLAYLICLFNSHHKYELSSYYFQDIALLADNTSENKIDKNPFWNLTSHWGVKDNKRGKSVKYIIVTMLQDKKRRGKDSRSPFKNVSWRKRFVFYSYSVFRGHSAQHTVGIQLIF